MELRHFYALVARDRCYTSATVAAADAAIASHPVLAAWRAEAGRPETARKVAAEAMRVEAAAEHERQSPDRARAEAAELLVSLAKRGISLRETINPEAPTTRAPPKTRP